MEAITSSIMTPLESYEARADGVADAPCIVPMASVMGAAITEADLLALATQLVDSASRGDADALAKVLFVRASHGQTFAHMFATRDAAALKRLASIVPTEFLDASDVDGCTPLHFACFNGNVDSVRVLLAADVKVHARSKFGSTPLQMAAMQGQLAVVQLLLHREPAMINVPNNVGWTPLHFAAMIGSPDIVGVLLAAGADIHVVNKYGRTALHLASANGRTAVIHMLRERGARTECQDIMGMTVDDWYFNPRAFDAFECECF
jgi:ankyrin repeat protein